MPNYNSSYSGAEIDGAVAKVIAAGTLASAPKILQKILGSGSWASGIQSITDASILANSAGDLKIAQTATAAQFTNFVNAQMQITGQTSGSITITCRGTVPAIDIPVIVEVR